jgi:hypothetical protein
VPIPDVIVEEPLAVTTDAVTVVTPVATVSFIVVVIVFPEMTVTVATPVATVLSIFSVTVLPDAVIVV